MSWKMSGRVKEIRTGMKGQPITRTDKLVLLVLADYYNERTKTSWPSLETLAEECLTSRVSLWRCLKRLETIGLLETKTGRWKEPEYALLPNGDPPSHFNLKHESHFKTDGIMFQNGNDHVSKPTEIEVLSIIEPSTNQERAEVQKLPLLKEGVDLEFKEKMAKLDQAREERKLRKQQKANGQRPSSRAIVPAKTVTNKQPESWIWFSTLFKRLTDTNAFARADLWPMLDGILEQTGQEELGQRLSLYIDGADRVTGYLAKDFIEGGWQTVDPYEEKMPRIVNED